MIKKIFLVCSMYVLCGCSSEVVTKGNYLYDSDIKALKVGYTTRDEVLKKFGAPSVALNDREVLYISTKQKGSKILEVRSIKLKFDGGKLSDIKRYTRE